MTTTLNNNGRQRQTLAAQIDRLDTMLDGLADGLNEAVRDAVVLAVQQAVSAVLTEVLTNPTVLAKLGAAANPAPVPAPAPLPSPQAKATAAPTLRQRLATCRDWFGQRLGRLARGCRSGWVRLGTVVRGWSSNVTLAGLLALILVKQQMQRTPQFLRLLWRYKLPISMALLVAATLGVAGFFAGPALAAVSSGVCGFVVTLAAQAGLRLRRFLAAATTAV